MWLLPRVGLSSALSAGLHLLRRPVAFLRSPVALLRRRVAFGGLRVLAVCSMWLAARLLLWFCVGFFDALSDGWAGCLVDVLDCGPSAECVSACDYDC